MLSRAVGGTDEKNSKILFRIINFRKPALLSVQCTTLTRLYVYKIISIFDINSFSCIEYNIKRLI